MGDKRFEEKTVTVLDNLQDAESVTKRYQAKGWEAVSFRTLKTKPPSIRIKLRREKAKQSPAK